MCSDELEKLVKLNVESFTKKALKGQVHEIDEEFSNALDVLECLLNGRNLGIINELQSVYNKKCQIIRFAYRSGFEDGLRLSVNEYKQCK